MILHRVDYPETSRSRCLRGSKDCRVIRSKHWEETSVMDAARREQMVRSQIAELRTWLNGRTFRDAASSGRAAVEQEARGHDQRSFLSMLSTVAALPWFSLARGVCGVVDGREAGWSDIRDSADLLHWWRRGVIAA